MIVYFLINGIAIALFVLALYSYTKIDEVTVDSETSKKILLSSFIISATFLVLSNFLYVAKFFTLNRTQIFLATSVVISAILLMISYNYLNKELKSSDDYEPKLKELETIEVNQNKKERNISLIGGIVGLSVIGAIIFVLIGKTFYSKETVKISTVKVPVYLEKEDQEKKYVKIE